MSRDALSSHIKAIDKKLAGLTPINAKEPCIFIVNEQLRTVNERAYKPMLLAIGPYNDHGKVGRGLMEEHKLRYLKQMLERKNECSVEAYIRTLRGLEERARNCYAEVISLTTHEFVEMMLLDGCFIIELFRKFHMRDEHDPIFQIRCMLPKMARDLLLFENQLPFFVLTELFMMIESSQTQFSTRSGHLGEHTINIEQNNEITNSESSISIDQRVQMPLEDLAISFFSKSLPPLQDHLNFKRLSPYSPKKSFQLCQTHKAITPLLAKRVHEHLKVGDKFKNADFTHLLDLIHTMIKLSVLDMELDRAIKSQEVGVKFKMSQEVGVKFKMGQMFKHVLGLIHRVSDVLARMKNMRGRTDKPIHYAIEHLYGQKRINGGWKSIPYGKELREAGVEFKMAEKFRDKFEENKYWESIPNAIVLQEAGVDVRKLIRNSIYPVRNSILEGRKLKKAEVLLEIMDTKYMNKKLNATELKECGVKFKKVKQRTMFAIQFSNGTLNISPLIIEDETETILRNLIAFEQYSPSTDLNYVTDYICFMDDLIDSPKDVQLLRRKGIIGNWLGDDELASTMVNKLGRHVITAPNNSLYDKTSADMNKYCAKRWNERMAKLRHGYFHCPWAFLSVLAAIILLGLAITQTVFSIIH